MFMLATNAIQNLELLLRLVSQEELEYYIPLCDHQGQNVLHYVARFESFGGRGFHDRQDAMDRCSAVRSTVRISIERTR